MNFYYVINIVYIYSCKKFDKILIHFVMQLRKSRFFYLARGILLDNGVTSPCKSFRSYKEEMTPMLPPV